MLIASFALGLFIFLFAFYRYSTKLYGSDTKVQYGIASIFNAILIIYYVFEVSYEYEYLATIILFLVYFIEIRLIFSASVLVALFRTLTLTLHVIAMRMIVIGYFALAYEIPIYELARNQELRILSSTAFFFITMPYVLIVRTLFLKAKFVDRIKEGSTILFSVNILVLTFIYCIFTAYSLYQTEVDDVKLVYIVVKTGICSLAAFFICFVYSYIFSNLNLQKKKFLFLSEAIKQGEEDLKSLSEATTIDPFTKLKVRDVAFTRINHFMSDNEPFYVFFLDMNGLKAVNDNHGHNEGDFYILQTVEILKENFHSETVVRFGGDEFVVIGKQLYESEPHLKIEKVISEVEKIAVKYSKDYKTSISYGLVKINPKKDSKLFENPDEIIKIADERMYQYKKTKNMHRAVVPLH